MACFAADYAGFSAGDKDSNPAHFTVDDLLDFPTEEDTITDTFLTANSGDISTLTHVDTGVSGGGEIEMHFNWNPACRSMAESQFPSNDLCVQHYDDLAELEWLSNFVEESFSTDDLRFIPASNAAVPTSSPSPPLFLLTDVAVPGKARSKRSRAPPCDWSSRLLHVPAPVKKLETAQTPCRRCVHCASEKTPQWRTGPMGPKTLCNACGVRYKSGRLVQEYRPAASPTFVPTKHSNSHRKVLELRRQKEAQQQQQLIGQVWSDEFLIHHRNSVINGQDLRPMI